MIGAIIFFLLGGGSFFLAYYLKGALTFEGGAADHILFWGAIVLGVIFALIGIDRLMRFLGERRESEKKPADAKKKTAKAAAQKPKTSFSEGGGMDALGTAIILFVAEALLMLITCLVVHWFFEDKIDLFSTILIILAALSYFLVFLGLAELNCEHEFFKKCKVCYRTRNEVYADVDKILSQTGYAVHVHRLALAMAPVFLLQAGIAVLIDPLCINFLVATPVILFITLIHILSGPKKTGEVTNDLIAHREGDDWKKHLCPKCGAILGKGHLADSSTLTGQSQSLGSRTYTVTDKYTNGYDTLYVDRTEKDYFIRTDSTYHHRYSCPRCKHTWSKDEYSSSREYI